MQRSSVDIHRFSGTNPADIKRSSRGSIEFGRQQKVRPPRANSKPDIAAQGRSTNSEHILEVNKSPDKTRRRVGRMDDVAKERHARRAVRLANTAEKTARFVAKPPTVIGGVVGGMIFTVAFGRDSDEDEELDGMWRGGFATGGAIVGGAVYAASETVAQATMLPTAAWAGQHWLKKRNKEPEPSSYGPVSTIKSALRNRKRVSTKFSTNSDKHLYEVPKWKSENLDGKPKSHP